MADIGKRIKDKRESLGMTQEELAFRLGYKNKSSIAKIETGTNDIVQSRVTEFANVLETTVAYLMGWEETNNSSHHVIELQCDNEESRENIQFALDKDNKELIELLKRISPDGKRLITEIAEKMIPSK